MVQYIIRRLAWALATRIIVSFVVFLIFYVVPPGDPAALRAGHFANPQLVAEIRHTLGLDKPFWVQCWVYVKALVLRFDLGYSYQNSQSVKTMILDRLPPTISLTAGAVVIWMAAGITVGVISAVRRRSRLDRVATLVSLLDLRPDLLAGPAGSSSPPAWPRSTPGSCERA
jgi:peptide/nickel transport system permease protein